LAPNDYLTEEEARALYAAGDAAHDFDHVLRVTRLAVRIAAAEGADVEVVRLAALLHDAPVGAQIGAQTSSSAGRGEQTGTSALQSARGAHHLAAAQFAADLLAGRGLETERIANVVHCIEAHRFRDRTVTPATPEARCLYDADKLDSIGAIGVGRAFAYGGAHGSRLWSEPWPDAPPDDARPQGSAYTPVHEYVYKLQRLQATLYTPTARAVAVGRHEFMRLFFDRLDAEMQGLA
jgi:uncharacterized protein